MVRITKDKNVYIKILFWGPSEGGKVAAVDNLHQICKDQDKEFIPTGNLVKIDQSSGATLYFDRGIFQHKKEKNNFFHVYTVADQQRFQPLRKKMFIGTDGILFITDCNHSRLQDSITYLKELKRVAEGDLIKKIPVMIMLNRTDADDDFQVERWEEILRNEGLIFEKSNPLSEWNPIIFKNDINDKFQETVYRAFSRLARRCIIYQVYGNGSAPTSSSHPKS